MASKQWKFNKRKSDRVIRLARKILPTVTTRTELVEKIASRCRCYQACTIETILSRAHFTTGFRYRKSAEPFGTSTERKILLLLKIRPRTSWELERHYKYSTLLASYRKLRTMGFPVRSTLILARGAGSTKSLIKHQFRIFFMEADAVKAYTLVEKIAYLFSIHKNPREGFSVEKTAGLTLVTKMRQSVGYSVKPKEYKKERATFKSKNPVRTAPSDERIKELFKNVR